MGFWPDFAQVSRFWRGFICRHMPKMGDPAEPQGPVLRIPLVKARPGEPVDQRPSHFRGLGDPRGKGPCFRGTTGTGGSKSRLFASECDDSKRLVGSSDQIWFVLSHTGKMFGQWQEDFEVTGDADLFSGRRRLPFVSSPG